MPICNMGDGLTPANPLAQLLEDSEMDKEDGVSSDGYSHPDSEQLLISDEENSKSFTQVLSGHFGLEDISLVEETQGLQMDCRRGDPIPLSFMLPSAL